MKRIVWPLKLNNILISVRECGRVVFSGSHRKKWLLSIASLRIGAANGTCMLAPAGCNARELRWMSLEIGACVVSTHPVDGLSNRFFGYRACGGRCVQSLKIGRGSWHGGTNSREALRASIAFPGGHDGIFGVQHTDGSRLGFRVNMRNRWLQDMFDLCSAGRNLSSRGIKVN